MISFPLALTDIIENMKYFSSMLMILIFGSFSLFRDTHCFSDDSEKEIFFNGIQSVKTGFEHEKEFLEADSCSVCHPQIYQNWKKDRHGQAWTNVFFQKAYKMERKDWCIHCHAPLEQQKLAIKKNYHTEDPLVSEGINCAACHIRNGKGVNLSYLRKPDFCMECHQFNFPVIQGEKIFYTPYPMQNTGAEWKEVKTDKRCQDCHFRNHQLEGPHSDGWLAEAFSDISVESEGERIFIYFVFQGAEHRAPTGDLFRSFSLEISSDPEFAKITYKKKWARFFQDGFVGDHIFWKRTLKRNSGFEPGENRISLIADRPGNQAVYIRFLYYFHDPELGGNPSVPHYENSILIWEKVLPPVKAKKESSL